MKNNLGERVVGKLNRSISTVSDRVLLPHSKKKHMTDTISRLKDAVARKQNQVRKLVEINKRLKNYNAELCQQRTELKAINVTNQKIRTAFKKKNKYYKKLRKRILIPVISNIHNFAKRCAEKGEAIKADVYLAHDDFPLLAARVLSSEYGGRIFYDAIEVPEHKDRTGIAYANWPLPAFYMIDHLREGIAPHLSGIITVSDPLAERVRTLCDNVVCIENFRYLDQLEKSSKLRNDCNIRDSDKLILFMNHITPNYFFEEVLESLCLLPDNFYLATLGRIIPKKYFEEIKVKVQTMNLDQRVFFFDPVPYEQLTSYASGADVGLIVRDLNVINNKISLPNRLFDYIFAHVPICSSPIPHIEKIIRQYHIGDIFQAHTPRNIADTIANVVNQSDTMKVKLEKASEELTWDKNEERFVKFLGAPERVTILGIKDLTQNNRTKRMALTLANSGSTVNIVTTRPYEGPMIPGITWHQIDL